MGLIFKRIGLVVITCALLLCFGCATATPTSNQSDIDVADEIDELNANNEELAGQNEELQSQVQELQTKNNELSAQNGELQKLVDEAQPWFELSEKEKEEQQAELEAQKEAERIAQEEEAKKGYDTGITYDQLARTPDDYIGSLVKFKGKVVQVMEGDGTTELRVAVKSDYDKIIYVFYDSSIVTTRVLEDDTITIMGMSTGLLSYESTMGGVITIPSIAVDIIEF